MSDVLIRKQGKAGHITLNRPARLNALTHQMALTIEAALLDWQTDNDVELVVIDAVGDRAFCAGGDVADLYVKGQAGQYDAAQQFWRDEYRMNMLIAQYPKPYVAFMDGITMGGGVGLSAHGSHRIVTPRTVFAMPECSIGLITDVGGTYLLAQTPGQCGIYLGLTGQTLTGADCLYAGLADYYVRAEQLDAVKTNLMETGDLSVLAQFSTLSEPSRLVQDQDQIDQLFAGDTVQQIIIDLQADPSEFATKALARIEHGAPLALRVTFDAIRLSQKEKSLEIAIRNEFRVVSYTLEQGELIEGVRAALIDKDKAPQWRYKTLSDVPQSLLDKIHQPAPKGDFSYTG